MAARKYTIVFYSALVVALMATYFVFRYMNSMKTSSQIATRAVVVAAKNISEGAAITEGDLRVEQWPDPVVPDGAFDGAAILSGRVAHVPIFAGEAIVPGRLAPEGTAPGLEARITPGKRAMGVRINDVSGMSGMIQPNSRVDILLTLDAGSEQRSAKLFMENMRVLAMGSEVTRGTDGRPMPSTVATLEVTPEEAERLLLATSQGQVQLVLRGYSDPGSAKTKGTTTGEVVANLKEVPKTTPRTQRQAPPPRHDPVIPVPKEQPVVQTPPATPTTQATTQKPETLTIPVYRGPKRSDEKFKKDSVKRDTIPF